MGKFSWMRLPAAAFLVVAVMEAANPAGAQNLNDLLRIFGGDKQRAVRQAQAEWRRLRPAEAACIDQRLRRKGSKFRCLVDASAMPWPVRLCVTREGDQGVVARAAVAAPTKEHAEKFTDPSTHFQGGFRA